MTLIICIIIKFLYFTFRLQEGKNPICLILFMFEASNAVSRKWEILKNHIPRTQFKFWYPDSGELMKLRKVCCSA